MYRALSAGSGGQPPRETRAEAGEPGGNRTHNPQIKSISEYHAMIAEALVRYMGLSEDRIRREQREVKNPLAWFREGVAGLLLLPVQLLQSLGLLRRSGAAFIARSSLFRFVAGLVALVGLLASCIELVLGSKPALASVRRYFGF